MMSLTWAARTWCRLLVVLAVVGGVRASLSSLLRGVSSERGLVIWTRGGCGLDGVGGGQVGCGEAA